MENKDKAVVKSVPLVETTSNQSVIPIINGKAQPQCTFEEYIENLPNNNTTTWSRI